MRPTLVLYMRKLFLEVTLATKVKEIRSILGYTPKQWALFKDVTAFVAQNRYETDAKIYTVNQLSSEEQSILETEVNAHLEKFGVSHMPGKAVLYWRWNRVFKNMRRTKLARQAYDKYLAEHVRVGKEKDFLTNVERLRTLVRAQIQDYFFDNPTTLWTEIPYGDKQDMMNSVNEDLQSDGIPMASEELLLVRMEMCLMTLRIRRNKYVREGFKKEEVLARAWGGLDRFKGKDED